MSGAPTRPKRHVRTLERREAWLSDVVGTDRCNDYDRRELVALRWALPMLRALVGAQEPRTVEGG